MGLLIAFAQAPPADPISGGAGWVGAGLLGCVLAWVFFVHLPAKDKQMAAKDEQIMGLIERQDERMAAAQTKYDASLSLVVKHCEEEMTNTTAIFRDEIARITKESHKA